MDENTLRIAQMLVPEMPLPSFWRQSAPYFPPSNPTPSPAPSTRMGQWATEWQTPTSQPMEPTFGQSATAALLTAMSAMPAGRGLPVPRPRTQSLPMDYASRMRRAKEMGFHTDVPLGHGTAIKGNKDFSEFSPAKFGSTTGTELAKLGVWTEVNPQPGGAADFYSLLASQRSGGGQVVKPLLHRADRPGTLDLAGENVTTGEVAATLHDAWDAGYDAVRLKNFQMSDGRRADFLVVKDPSQLRSPSAAFDPAKKSSRNLLAGIAGGGILAPLALDPETQR
jgi:hypothetical protein